MESSATSASCFPAILLPIADVFNIASRLTRNLLERDSRLAAKGFAFHCRSTSLVVAQQNAAFAEFLLILGPVIVNGLLLLAIDPCSQEHGEKAPGLEGEAQHADHHSLKRKRGGMMPTG